MTGFDVAVVGGGVIGLAVARRAAAAGRSVVLLERRRAFGLEISSRNSEVVHGGMYYAPGSLKAALCVAGRRRLYDYCRERGIPHRRCGKVIVAADAGEEDALAALAARGAANGVEGLRFLSRAELADLAPGVRAAAALHSPETGVVSAHAFMDAVKADAEGGGALLVAAAEVTGLARGGDGWEVRFQNAGAEESLVARVCVNAAGLGAQAVMRLAGLDPEAADLRLHPCKGSYFSVRGEARRRIRGLVYPVPEANLAGLGVHTVVDVGGGVKLGPDAEYIDPAEEYDYAVDPARAGAFYAGAARFLPFLEPGDIHPDMAGVRPKLSGPGQPPRDFYLADEAPRGLPGFINMAGLESPGLTAALAVAERVAGYIAASLD